MIEQGRTGEIASISNAVAIQSPASLHSPRASSTFPSLYLKTLYTLLKQKSNNSSLLFLLWSILNTRGQYYYYTINNEKNNSCYKFTMYDDHKGQASENPVEFFLLIDEIQNNVASRQDSEELQNELASPQQHSHKKHEHPHNLHDTPLFDHAGNEKALNVY